MISFDVNIQIPSNPHQKCHFLIFVKHTVITIAKMSLQQPEAVTMDGADEHLAKPGADVVSAQVPDSVIDPAFHALSCFFGECECDNGRRIDLLAEKKVYDLPCQSFCFSCACAGNDSEMILIRENRSSLTI